MAPSKKGRSRNHKNNNNNNNNNDARSTATATATTTSTTDDAMKDPPQPNQPSSSAPYDNNASKNDDDDDDIVLSTPVSNTTKRQRPIRDKQQQDRQRQPKKKKNNDRKEKTTTISSSSLSSSSSSCSNGRNNVTPSPSLGVESCASTSKRKSTRTKHVVVPYTDTSSSSVQQRKQEQRQQQPQMTDDIPDVPLSSLKRKKVSNSSSIEESVATIPTTKTKATTATSKATLNGTERVSPANATTTTTSSVAAKKQGATAAAAAAAGTTQSTKRNNTPTNSQDDSTRLIMASDTDSDDEKDRPYRVEYATTGRSTCRSCDERIDKKVVRISSCPLFRGKPGFTVYRHLHCQVFPLDEVTKIQDVGGYRRLAASDRELLQQQIEESVRVAEKENEELDADELVQTAFQGELRPPPPGLAATLLPFQVEGVSWMYNQEHDTTVRGGILADEMGMGKTLQTITTILDNRPMLQHSVPGMKHPPLAHDLLERKREEQLWDETLQSCHYDLKMANVPESALRVSPKKGVRGSSRSDSSGGVAPIGVRAGTLVICPVIALYQWKEEIEKFTLSHALSVCIYHGNDRVSKFPRELLAKYDVVLTTYQVVEMDFRKMVSPNKVKCPNCGRAFKIDKLSVHLKYFCGETAQRTEAQSRQRRTADRPSQGQSSQRGGRGGRGSDGGGGNMKKKLPLKSVPPKTTKMTSAKKGSSVGAKPTMTNSKTKKTIRARKGKDYDSDSDLSVVDDVDYSTVSKRPSRSAARTAAKKMHVSSKDWAGSDSDSDAFSEGTTNPSSDDDDDDDDESSDDDDTAPPVKARQPPQTSILKRGSTPASDSTDDSSSDDESEDEAAIARATKRQKIALEQAKKNSKKKVFPPKKAFTGGAKSKKKGGRKPSFDDDSSSSSSDGDDDPLKGVDMNALREEALDGCQPSILHTMSWWRIVLDEAHMIKSRSSQTASAAFHLSAVHRWALSGTPLQNRVGEMYSLIRFLRIDPMAHYFCRMSSSNCKSIYYRMENGKCKECGCASSQHFSYFNKHVLNVIQREGYAGDGRRAMMKLKTEVLDRALLRRTKESRAEDMNLPPRVVTIKCIRLHPREDDFYNALYTQTKSSFDDYVTEGTLLNNYAHIFDLLTKMRQAVDHPYLIVHSKKNHAIQAAMGRQGPAVANGSTVCEICDETPTDRVVSSCCGAAFCRSCVMEMMSLENLNNQDTNTRCPSCRNPFSIDLSQECQHIVDDATLTISSSSGSDKSGMPSLKEMSHVASGSILRRIDLGEFATSTKVEALVQELVEMRKTRQGSKALVFSQFVNMLDLVRWRLHSDPCLQGLGLGVRIIHGGMNVQSRDEALRDFREDSSIRVLLMSLKAGGVALNLTVANEAYLLDPWWNPAAEMQAIDRTHRLGQYRPIRAVRFIAEGTVEERVLQLQEKKRLVFDGTVGRDAASLKMLTVDDMRALFT